MATLSVTQLLHVDAFLFSLWLFYIKSKSAQTKTLEGSPRLSFSWLLVKQEHLLELDPWPPPEERAGQLTHPFRRHCISAQQRRTGLESGRNPMCRVMSHNGSFQLTQ